MEFVKNMGLPDKDITLFICDRMCEKIDLAKVVPSYEHSEILNGIATHPDMTFCHLGGNKCVVAKEAYEYYKEHLSQYGLEIIKGKNEIKKEYPYDISLNCVIINNILFHKLKYTDEAIIDYCEAENIKLVNVNQGYTKCSTLIVDEKSVITCDEKLYEIYLENKISALYVSNKGIEINGFDHGFIGGCGGKISKEKIGFFGELEKFADFVKVREFLKKHNIEYVNLRKGMLKDYGTLIPLK